MKSFVILAAFVAIAAALPTPQESAAAVITNENNNIGVGAFQTR